VCSALDGVDEYMSPTDVPRRMLATPRRQMPTRSMIEGNGLDFRWQSEVNVSENCVVHNSQVGLLYVALRDG